MVKCHAQNRLPTGASMQETEVNIETEEEFPISENGDGGSAHTSPEALTKENCQKGRAEEFFDLLATGFLIQSPDGSNVYL